MKFTNPGSAYPRTSYVSAVECARSSPLLYRTRENKYSRFGLDNSTTSTPHSPVVTLVRCEQRSGS